MVYQILNANCDFSLISFKRAWDRRKSRQTIRQTDRQTDGKLMRSYISFSWNGRQLHKKSADKWKLRESKWSVQDYSVYSVTRKGHATSIVLWDLNAVGPSGYCGMRPCFQIGNRE